MIFRKSNCGRSWYNSEMRHILHRLFWMHGFAAPERLGRLCTCIVSVSVSVLRIVYCACLECTLWLILLLHLVTFCPWAVNRWGEGGGRGGPTSQVANIVSSISGKVDTVNINRTAVLGGQRPNLGGVAGKMGLPSHRWQKFKHYAKYSWYADSSLGKHLSTMQIFSSFDTSTSPAHSVRKLFWTCWLLTFFPVFLIRILLANPAAGSEHLKKFNSFLFFSSSFFLGGGVRLISQTPPERKPAR